MGHIQKNIKNKCVILLLDDLKLTYWHGIPIINGPIICGSNPNVQGMGYTGIYMILIGCVQLHCQITNSWQAKIISKDVVEIIFSHALKLI